jgi:hypothetical protein
VRALAKNAVSSLASMASCCRPWRCAGAAAPRRPAAWLKSPWTTSLARKPAEAFGGNRRGDELTAELELAKGIVGGDCVAGQQGGKTSPAKPCRLLLGLAASDSAPG